MKTIIFAIMAIFVLSTLDARAKTLKEDAFSVSYVNGQVDMAPVVLLDIKPITLPDVAFKVAVSSSMLEFEEKTQTNNNLISRVVFSLCCKF